MLVPLRMADTEEDQFEGECDDDNFLEVASELDGFDELMNY